MRGGEWGGVKIMFIYACIRLPMTIEEQKAIKDPKPTKKL